MISQHAYEHRGMRLRNFKSLDQHILVLLVLFSGIGVLARYVVVDSITTDCPRTIGRAM